GGAHDANDTLKRLITGESIAVEDASHLSKILKRSLKKKLQELQKKVPEVKSQSLMFARFYGVHLINFVEEGKAVD
ncbi:MAG: hypothetical protein MI861_25035, partial [Pirellulales bacterium]|nr:hypothetical protein [Pirellulales bacterium]